MNRLAMAFAVLGLLLDPAGAQEPGPAPAPADAGLVPATADADPAPAPTLELGPPVGIVFQINDSLVKDKVLADTLVELRASAEAAPMFSGRTGPDGRFALKLPAGRWLATYRRSGYVSVENSPTEIRTEGQVITTTLTMLLESTGQVGQKRIQIVLNWGSDSSQVKDADSHLACACGQDHVYFGHKVHTADTPKHEVNLDVDDMDWGGPETVTILDPVPGTYTYWVHNYSGSPDLGTSDVLVRLILDDAVAGEYPIPKTWSAEDWRPFKAIVVGSDGTARIEPYSPAELQAGAPGNVPAELHRSDEDCDGSCVSVGIVVLMVVIWIIGILAKKK